MKYMHIVSFLFPYIVSIHCSESPIVSLELITDYNESQIMDAVAEAVKFGPELKVNLEKILITHNFDSKVLCNTVLHHKTPFLIIEIIKNVNSLKAVQQLAQQVSLPLISFNLFNYRSMNSNIIIIKSPFLLLMESVALLIEYKNLSNVFIFYDLTYESFIKNNKIDNVGVDFISPNMDIMRTQLIQLKKQQFTNIFILAKTFLINLFLESIQQMDMFRLPYTWHALSHGKDKIKCISCSHATLTVVQPDISNYHEYDLSPSFPQLNMDNKLETYFYFDATRLILKSIHHLLANDQEQLKLIHCDHFNYSALHLDKDRLINQMLKENETFNGKFGDFKFVPNTKDTSKWNIFQDLSLKVIKQNYLYNQLENKTMGYIVYNDYAKPIFIKPSSFEESDQDLMTVVTLVHAPFVMKKISNSSSEEGEFTYYGLLVDILEEIKKELNGDFPKYEIIEDSQGLYGTQSSFDEQDAQWNGAVNTIISGAHMGLIAMTIEADRELVISFTEPIFDAVGLSIMMKKPERQDHFYKYITVLEANVWLCIIASYFLTSMILALFDYYSPYSLRNIKLLRPEDGTRIFTFKESLWFCFTSITPQGGGEAPRAVSGKFVVATWWLFGFIVVASYTANLAAFLTVSRLEKSVNNFDELTKQYKIRYSAIKSTLSESFFEKMARFEELYYEIWKDISLNPNLSESERAMFAVWDYPVNDKYTQIWAQMKEADPPASLEGALKRVKSSPSFREGYALIGESLSIDYLTNLDCDVYSVGSPFSFRPLAFPINKQDKYGLKEKLDPIIKKFKENGKIESLRAKYLDLNEDNQVCEEFRKLTNGISLYNSGGLFIVIGLGVTLSLLSLSFETYMLNNFLKKRFKTQQTLEHQNIEPNQTIEKSFFRKMF